MQRNSSAEIRTATLRKGLTWNVEATDRHRIAELWKSGANSSVETY